MEALSVQNLHAVHHRITSACQACGRDVNSVRLLAVSKTYHANAIATLATAGQKAFGENYVQEGIKKIQVLSNLGLTWHCVGPVQGNKTRQVAEHFAWLHTLDREKIALRLHAQRPEHLSPLNVCIQVNGDASPTKAGVKPEAVRDLAYSVQRLSRLRLRGLMVMPDPADDAQTLQSFRETAALWALLKQEGLMMDTLSMGMSHDLELAIRAGSTMVRVGTAIFGARSLS